MGHDWKSMSADAVFETGVAALERGDFATVEAARDTLRTRTTKLSRRLLAELEDRATQQLADDRSDASVGPPPPEGWEARIAEIARDFRPKTSGPCRVYLILCWDYRGHGKHGVYVGQTSKEASVRFDEHKSGRKSSRAVRKWGVRVLDLAPHLVGMLRDEAKLIEQTLAAALEAEGFQVLGGH